MTVVDAPSPPIPLRLVTDEPAPAPPKRDYAREAPTGNSVGYAKRRLERNRPDLYEKVKVGEISPSKAMVEAGFKPRVFQVPEDPARAAHILRKHFTGDAFRALVRELTEGDES